MMTETLAKEILLHESVYSDVKGKFFHLSNVSKEFLESLCKTYNAKDKVIFSEKNIRNWHIVRKIVLDYHEKTGSFFDENAILYKITTYINDEIVDEYETRESMNCWAIHTLDYYVNDWTEYPVNLNNVEQIITDGLREIYPNGCKQFYVQIKSDDSQRLFSISTLLLGHEFTARKIYESIAEKYRNHIIGIYKSKEDGGIHMKFDNNEFDIDKEKYINAKANWCAKYGCE